MRTDLVGRVNNYKLPGSKGLLPLFEAIVNSIHAIEDSGRPDGRIDIYIERSGQGNFFKEAGYLESIEGFTLRDNGIGFDDAHFESFGTSDTTFNAERGGKGVGRFSWLKAFSDVSISSIFRRGDSFYKRDFEFKLSEKAIENEVVAEIDAFDTETTIRLLGFKEDYRKKTPKTATVLCNRIIEHCLEYFVNRTPTIRLIDEQADESITLNDVFRENIKVHSQKQLFTCKSYTFNLLSLRLYSASEDAEHKVCLCAHNREVESDRLSKKIPQLKNKIQDENGRFFTYMGYVSSQYLDERVNSERTGFSIQEKTTELECNSSKTAGNICPIASSSGYSSTL